MLDLSPLNGVNRLLMTVPLRPLQGDRFQPTGFPSLGAATYQTKDGPKLLVESAQSMANRLEATCWDMAKNEPVETLKGISHVTVTRRGAFLTDSMLEAHRLNSVYIEHSRGEFFTNTLPQAIGANKDAPIDRQRFVTALLKYDVGCLIHGVFLESIDGRLRTARALSSFIEASGVQVAPSGGVKNDRVRATKEEGKTSKEGFGNVPFARDEYVADRIDCYFNLDLAQIRGYGLGDKVERLLILLALYKIRKLLDGDLRLRTACELEPIDRDNLHADRPQGFKLPSLDDLESAVSAAISECRNLMVHTTVTYEDDLKKAKDDKKPKKGEDEDSGVDEESEGDSED
ncbi:MAG: type I-U CRISPR-associated RAMP protein Csb1/Cas7u [Gemmataceae bacterium]|nr:type I-U CRISPR-associated RAMP protein Csb1/Cas7u [Gemmataceae bacterium]